jgi:hypothetical protein
VAVPEDDQVSVGEPTAEPVGPSLASAAVVDHGDANPFEIELQCLREGAHEQAIVVTEHSVGLGEALQLCERSG